MLGGKLDLFRNAVLVSLLLASLSWLLNPHACCPRLANASSPMKCACEAMLPPMEAAMEESCCQSESDCGQHSILPDDQFSKGVSGPMNDSVPGSLPLMQHLEGPFVFVIPQAGYEMPDSAVLPLAKKPPRL